VIPKNSKSRAREVLKLVHIDLCGSFSIPSFFGSKYFVTFINDFSRKTWVYFLKKKLDVLFVFKTFKTKMEKQIGKFIKILKSNNGGEFISNQFLKYCQDSKIRRQFSQAYTPNKMGLSKGKIDLKKKS
jgi:transposase InsO family protein